MAGIARELVQELSRELVQQLSREFVPVEVVFENFYNDDAETDLFYNDDANSDPFQVALVQP